MIARHKIAAYQRGSSDRPQCWRMFFDLARKVQLIDNGVLEASCPDNGTPFKYV